MVSEQQTCEFLATCPQFAYFSEHDWQVYITLYCRGNFTVCRCRQLLANGEPVPANLLPYGGVIREHSAQVGAPADDDRELAGAEQGC